MSISVSNLTVVYPSGRRAVDGASFTVAPGEVVALLGGNGAGKSTTMKVLAGVVPATAGTVTVAGQDLSTDSGADTARSVTGYCPDIGGLPRQLSVRECIGLALACTHELQFWPAAFELAERLDLARVLDDQVGSFSHGMARRTSALLALLGAKGVLLLDEPFDGVDADGVAVLSEAIRAAADAGLAVVISTHLMDVATTVADRCVVMADGRVVAEIDPADLAGPDGAARYLDLLHTPAPTDDLDDEPAAPQEGTAMDATHNGLVKQTQTSWTPGELPGHLALSEPDLSAFDDDMITLNPQGDVGDVVRALRGTVVSLDSFRDVNPFTHWTQKDAA